jgi:hypothetical protein
MPVKRPFVAYLRSRLNLWIAGAAVLLIVLSGLALGPWALAGVLVVLAGYAVVTLLLFFSGRGAREIVEEGDEARRKKVREKIAAAAALRERISVLRIADPAMAKAIEYFLLVSGTYIDACRERDLYSPQANKRMEDVREICQVFLGEMDEGATGGRYGVQDGESPEEMRRRSVEAVMEASADVKGRITEDLEGVSREDRLAIIEELEGKQGEDKT